MNSPENMKKILCIGDMVADIFSSPIERFPEPGQLGLTDEIAVYPGGNALNTAIALSRMGEQVAIAGSVGDDALGSLLLNQLQSIGLDVRGVHREPEGQTASTFILRIQGEDRRYIHALGVAADFNGEHVSMDLLADNGIVLIGGYLKLGAWDDEGLAKLLYEAHQRNCRVVFNVCIAQGSGVDPSRCLPLLEHVDVFVPNEDEARIITGETTLAGQAKALRRAGARAVVITRGQHGLYADDGAQTVEMGIFSVPVVDPSGCGDCFTAGIAAAQGRDWDLVRTLKFASAAGALGATALGCTNGVPSFAEVERFVKENHVKIIVNSSDNS
ncbi:MAG: carbohydrate kinase family protein [Sedimentisphaerales bacterium]|nr:carbohydrate kinase family protein [Sedimentisphaerales bacterium]